MIYLEVLCHLRSHAHFSRAPAIIDRGNDDIRYPGLPGVVHSAPLSQVSSYIVCLVLSALSTSAPSQRMPTQTGKRPSIEALPAASSSSSTLQLHHPSQSATLYPLFASLIFHIVPAKLEDDIGVLYQSIEDLGGRCDGLEAARWVVSALKGRARLARVLDKWMVRSLANGV